MPSVIVKPLINESALVIKGKNLNILCVADVHIGYEFALRQAGFRVPLQTERLVERLYRLARKVNAKKVLILGDVKHELSTSKQGLRECSSFLNEIVSFVDVEIVKGNHDIGIEKLLPENVVLHGSRGIFLPEYNLAILHGHAWPKADSVQADQIIIGHNHPVIELKNVSGARWLEPVWLKIRLDRSKLTFCLTGGQSSIPDDSLSILVMPAFNPLLGGTPVNSCNELLGPLLSSKLVNLNEASIILLDGTLLGKLKHLALNV